MQQTHEMWVRSPGQEDPLEEEMATHSCAPAWEIPRTEEPGGLQSTGSQRLRYDLVTEHHTHCVIILSAFSNMVQVQSGKEKKCPMLRRYMKTLEQWNQIYAQTLYHVRVQSLFRRRRWRTVCSKFMSCWTKSPKDTFWVKLVSLEKLPRIQETI